MKESWKIETQAIQGGYSPEATQPRILPIIQSTTFKYDSAEHVAKLFDLDAADHMYSRISNPTTAGFEGKIALMEGGVAALATSAGQAASTLAILNICRSGQHVVAASTLYGGTYSLFANTLPKMGIEVTFIDPNASAEQIKAAFRAETRALFAETIGNPGLNILDFEKFAAVAKAKQVPLIIDNTFATPFLCRPLEHGANIVVHSATKYIDGHATSVGGVIVDGGNFDWSNGRFPELTEPDPSYHGLRYVEKFGPLAYIVKARVQLMRDLGTCPAPMNSFLFNLGLETLPLRMERHSENALKLARFLAQHPKVSWVNYPGLENHPSYQLAKRYLPKGCSGVLTFGIKGGVESGAKFMENCRLVALVVHVGDARSCTLHPASTTHRQLTEQQQSASGVTPDLIRISVGIEHIDDIIADVDQALLNS
ncbi:O-acetylhomoserine aminocarboxypropyltransferase [Desulfuromonas versatilis]|uniref:O-acetylhomoserine aminocarboxypropyltransferase n=1 Tax=Desulfuromonas versatilis TaxID=2802975 RepID=A0ABN6DXE3_9BACT|nr:O-acetylhomoserine aminocarboxypropyltransferase/cysteine synthase family protein [Desulfuromonas versatilis]BCR04775.1 O-acetylhomoserine aminocarboxypropyltransferase [Desulfuromonas versatilis]